MDLPCDDGVDIKKKKDDRARLKSYSYTIRLSFFFLKRHPLDPS
jgi:hypothetical protein